MMRIMRATEKVRQRLNCYNLTYFCSETGRLIAPIYWGGKSGQHRVPCFLKGEDPPKVETDSATENIPP
jgi:hypothetical protein